ncbi:MAG: hypothetical protein ACD_2C00180G0013 [uncultured bacterium (gcode 4)]|uniref:DUF1002 domain-containing protein n=1 Tax=uncultured bacterium (gcode 4) TaxID=1234023 RepID=K2H0S2_9BACT|nr:MAG: hypothetical protein ACD_2C00180G0013 [uncultured bacterium (gcode 4)]
MQNKNKYLAIVLSWTLLFSTLAQAETSKPWAMGLSAPWMKTAQKMIQSPTEMLQPIMQFFRSGKDLTDEQKKQFMDSSRAYLDSIKKIMEDKSMTPDSREAAIKAANAEFAKVLTPYIDPTKLEAFNKFVANNWGKPFVKGPGESQNTKQPIQSPTEILQPIMQFFRSGKDLTAEQKKQFMDSSKAYLDSIKKIMEDKSMTPDSREAAIKAANAEFAKALTPYIDPAKLEAFNKFVADHWGKPLVRNPVDTKYQDDGKKQNISDKKKFEASKARALPQSTIDQLNRKLDALDPAKKEAMFRAIIIRVDAILKNVKSEKVRAQLEEIKDIVQNKLEDLNSWESDIVNELINWIDSDSTWSVSQ